MLSIGPFGQIAASGSLEGIVKGHQLVSDTAGYFTGTLDDNDHFGRSVANLGDLDGDGVADLAVGAFYDDDGGVDAGAVWILLLNNDGTVKSHQKISNTQGNFTGILRDGDAFGTSLANLDDVDGDGVIDLAVGAFHDDDGGYRRGAVWVLFLNRDGTVKGHRQISDTSGGFQGTLNNNDCFGASVANLGDLDGDGATDLAVGAYRDDDGGLDCGAVWVLFLNGDGTVKGHRKISDPAGAFLDDVDLFGISVANLGDFDRDGVTDLAVGAYFANDGGADRGSVWILFLNPDGTYKSRQKISDTRGNFAGGLSDTDAFGRSLVNLGDVDADGVIDLAVGAPGDDDGGPDRGAAWVLYLNPDGTVKNHQKISRTEGNFKGVLDQADLFTSSMADVGDLDGDGVKDLAVGAHLDDDGGTGRGAFWLLFLNPWSVEEVASDNFESGDFSGGTGWLGTWSTSGDLAIQPNADVSRSDPFRVRLRDGSGYMERSVDLTGKENVRLQFWSRVSSFEWWDRAEVRVSPDGANWTVVQSFTAEDNGNVYRGYDIDLSDFEMTSRFRVAFDAGMSSSADNWYIDDVALVSAGPFNEAPVADAGRDQAIADGNWDGVETVTLDGSASFDRDGFIAGYEWTEDGRVLGNTAVVTADLAVGVHDITLTVTDNKGASGIDTVTVRIDPGEVINFHDHVVASYGGPFQDVSGSATVEDDGATLHLTGNVWKKIDISYRVTEDTVLEFDFKSTKQGEIHGVGLDTDLSISADRTFELYGTQDWGYSDFADYGPAAPGYRHYRIPVGRYYTGQMDCLFFVNDRDAVNPTAVSYFSNVKVLESQLIDFHDHVIESYGGAGQDVSGSASIVDDGATLHLTGNVWKRIDLAYPVTRDTVLEFDFKSGSQGEIHGIGLDTNLSISPDRTFQLYGTQNWGYSDFKDYGSAAPGYRFYQIPIGQYFTGQMEYLFFVNDHDTSNPRAESFFRNVRIYES
jgi:hypothetical protein